MLYGSHKRIPHYSLDHKEKFTCHTANVTALFFWPWVIWMDIINLQPRDMFTLVPSSFIYFGLNWLLITFSCNCNLFSLQVFFPLPVHFRKPEHEPKPKPNLTHMCVLTALCRCFCVPKRGSNCNLFPCFPAEHH